MRCDQKSFYYDRDLACRNRYTCNENLLGFTPLSGSVSQTFVQSEKTSAKRQAQNGKPKTASKSNNTTTRLTMKSILFLTLLLCIVPGSFAGDFTLYFTRHFEKQTGTNPALTQQGVEKAQALALLLEHADIQKVYSTNYRRTQQSAAPIALKVNTAVTFYDPRDLTQLAAKLLSEQQNAVVVGHSNTTPDIIGLVGGEANPISETEFGDVYMLRYSTQSQSGEPLDKPALVNTVHVKLQ